MSNTKQPSEELVEKMKEGIVKSGKNRPGMSDNITLEKSDFDIASIQCAQIAVDYAEEENRELREALKESTKAIEWYMDSCTPKNEDYTTFFNLGMNQRVENEQLQPPSKN